MNLASTIAIYAGGPGSGCNPKVGKCGRSWSPKKINGTEKSDSGYVYHATNAERAYDIADGYMQTHKPSEYTDQDSWPDRSTEKRSYFTKNAGSAYQFSPEEGQPVLLRMPYDEKIHKTESTGDIYTTKKLPSNKFEVLGDDDNWHLLPELK
jgi:hypothetical protein